MKRFKPSDRDLDSIVKTLLCKRCEYEQCETFCWEASDVRGRLVGVYVDDVFRELMFEKWTKNENTEK